MKLAVPVVRTKIIIPRRRTELLSRPRLLSILENVLDLRLLILAAPAGYGKTSLLIDFAYHTQLPVCWFSIDALDNDPQRFIAHFIAAISNTFPSFGETSRAALNNLDQNMQNLDPVISTIINDVYDNISEHFVFVLDDYQFVRDCKPIDEFLNRITLEMSENCHMVISSRTLLTLPDLTLLVARSQVGGLSFEELAFLPEEIKQLFSVNYHQSLSEEAALDLVEQTEGWITGLLLTAQLSPKETSNRLRLARVSGIGLYEYLAQQVLVQLPDDLILFLKRTSLFEEFDASLCERVFSKVPQIEKNNWQEKVETILRENLFVLPVDDETLHLRYHHLFRDFLQNCMQTERPEESASISLEIAQYYEECREWERAFAVLARIGDVEKLVGLVLRAAPSMILGGRLIALSSWLEELPESLRNTRPELLSIEGTMAMLKGDIKTSLQMLNQAINGLQDHADQEELARALIRRSSLFRLIGSYEEEKADAEAAVIICQTSGRMEKLEAEALRAVGLAFYLGGDLKNAQNSLNASLARYREMAEEMDAAKILLDLGLVYLTLGELDEAEKAYQSSLDYWNSTQNSLWQANLLNNLGIIQHMRGAYEQAAVSFEKAISHARYAINPRLEGFSLTSLGDLYRDIRALPEARRAYDLAGEASRSVDDQALRVFLSLSHASVERLTGNEGAYTEKLNTALSIAQKGGSKYEISLCKLEQGLSSLLKGEFAKTRGIMKELVQYLSKGGFHLEYVRAQFYLALTEMLLHRSAGQEQELSRLIEERCAGSDQYPFIQTAFETLDLLDGYCRDRKNDDPLTAFVNRLREYENGLAPLRRTIRRHSEAVQFTSPKFVIRVFGKCQVKIGDHQVALSEWKTQVVRDIFYFILLHPEGVTKEEIGAAFWPESTAETLRVRFKNSIYRLRHALGSESINYEDDNYRFNRTLEYDYDVEVFLHELALAQNSDQLDARITHYRQAANHYKGPYLPKIDYEWAIVQREQYHRQFINGITSLINIYLQIKQYQLAIQYANRAIEEDACCEEAYRLAMQAFFALGDRVAATRQFEKCRRVLKKELGLEPTPQTVSLFDELTQ